MHPEDTTRIKTEIKYEKRVYNLRWCSFRKHKSLKNGSDVCATVHQKKLILI